jgi:hypothetical protein
MESYVLDEKQAYKAMIIFLEHLYNLTKDDALGGILGSMQLLSDGEPIDRAYWVDWLNAVNKVVGNDPSSSSINLIVLD